MAQMNAVPAGASTAPQSDAPTAGAREPRRFALPPVPASGGIKKLARTLVGPAVYSGVRSMYQLSRRERGAPYALTKKLDAWRHGFLAESAAIYDFPRNDMCDYLSDWAWLTRGEHINPYNLFLKHKLMLRVFLHSLGFPQPETVAVAAKGYIRLEPFGRNPRYVPPSEFARWLLDDGDRFVVKPEDGSRGKDIYLLESQDGRLVRRRGRDARPFDVAELPDGVTLVERMVRQGEFWRALCAHSTNTLRVQTMWTTGDPEPFIARTVQRMGTADTAPTDNWSGGGICATVDLETGRMGPGRMHPLKGNGSGDPYARYPRHPDSGAPIEGAVVPHWNAVKDTVLRAASSLPVYRYVGWDVYVDEAGAPIIGEGQGNPDVNLLQVHGGLLAEPAIRRFYEKTGLV